MRITKSVLSGTVGGGALWHSRLEMSGASYQFTLFSGPRVRVNPGYS